MSQVAPAEIPAFINLWKARCRALSLFSEAVQKIHPVKPWKNKAILRLALIRLPVSAQKHSQQELSPYLNALLNWMLVKGTEQAAFLEEKVHSPSLSLDALTQMTPQQDMCMCVNRPGAGVTPRDFQAELYLPMAKAGLMDALVLRVFCYCSV